MRNQESNLFLSTYVLARSQLCLRLETTGKHCYWVDLCNPLVRVLLLTNYLLLQSGRAYLREVLGLSYGSGQEQPMTCPGIDVENQERAQALQSQKSQLKSQ